MEKADEGSVSRGSAFARALVLCVLIITLGTLAGLYLLVRSLPDSIRKSIEQHQVVATFASYVSGLAGSNRLQVAQLKTQEEFFLSSEKRLLEYLPGGTVEVSARVPSEIVYQVSLEPGSWKFLLADGGRRLHVIAPEIEFNTPAIDLRRYKIEVVKYSYIRDEEEVKQLLQAQIPEKLEEVALANIDTVRDTARLKIKEFVDNWLITSFAEQGVDLPVVDRVFFQDEEEIYQHLVNPLNPEIILQKEENHD